MKPNRVEQLQTRLYLIAGPARVGKSTVARTFSTELGIGWLSVDVLRDLLMAAGIQFGESAGVSGAASQAETFYPFLQRFAWSSCAIHGSYCIEGVYVMPAQAEALRIEGISVRACFLGNRTMDSRNLWEHAGSFEWVRELSEERRKVLAGQIREVSEHLSAEAPSYGWKYVDMGDDFSEGVRSAVKALTDDHP